MNEFVDLLFNALPANFIKNINHADKIKKNLHLYIIQYKEAQKHINISAIRDDRDIVIRHILDSIFPFYSIFYELKIIPLEYLYKRRWIDLGTGIGLPGLILKIFYPQINIALAEIKKKNIQYLNHILNCLKLNQVSIVDSSQRKITKNYHFVITRAYGSLLKIWKESKIYLNKSGKIIAYKGKKEKIDLEIKELLNNQGNLKIFTYKMEIPLLKAEERHIVYIKSN